MTRNEAKEIALTEIKKSMLEYGEDAIYVAAPQPGKNTWTWKEAYESVMNDTCLENTLYRRRIMNRMHKYRGKNLASNDWVYGNIVYTDNLSPAIYFQIGKGSVKRIDFLYVKPDTICEFSNVYDKNGQEIYEGDIIEFYVLRSYCINPDCEPHLLGYGMRMDKVTGIVTFTDGMFGVENDYDITPICDCDFREIHKEDLKNEISDPYFDYDPNECNINDIDSFIGVKVIGNIYDNPEL